MATRRSAYFVFLLMVLPLIIFAQTSEPQECSEELNLFPMLTSEGTYVRNVSNTFYINCFDGAVCPVSTSSVTWEVEPANQDNEMIMNDVIMFTSLTPENNGTTIQCSLFCLNCSDLRRSNTVTLVVNGISLYSSRRVYRPNYEASFFCSDTSFSAMSIQWLINETLIENLNLSNANARLFRGLGRLDITHTPLAYNGTTIQCRANFGNGNSILSNILTLLVEGTLSAVGSLSAGAEHGNITITWIAPFSVDILLSYCIKVYSTTSLIHTECGISTTEYYFPIGRVCSNNTNYYYSFIITPVNVAGYGESATTNYTQSVTFSDPQAKAVHYLRMPGSSEVSTYQISMSSPVCDGELVFTDQDTREKIFPVESELVISGDTISIASEQLNINRHYNVTVSANNANGSALSHIMLSTHGIKDITVDNTPHVVMTTEYFKNSTDKGAFLFFPFTNCTLIDFSKSFYLALDRNASLNYTLPDDLTPGQYHVFAYDIESDGMLHNGENYPADEDNFNYKQGAELNLIQQPRCAVHVDVQKFNSKDIKDCTVTLNGDVISATCSYSSDSAATGFQMIVQKNNIKVHVLLINRTTKHFSTGPVTVQVGDENGTYHVAIFPLLGEKGIVNTTLAHAQKLPKSDSSQENSTTVKITAVAVSVTVVLMILSLILCFFYWRKKRNDADKETMHLLKEE